MPLLRGGIDPASVYLRRDGQTVMGDADDSSMFGSPSSSLGHGDSADKSESPPSPPVAAPHSVDTAPEFSCVEVGSASPALSAAPTRSLGHGSLSKRLLSLRACLCRKQTHARLSFLSFVLRNSSLELNRAKMDLLWSKYLDQVRPQHRSSPAPSSAPVAPGGERGSWLRVPGLAHLPGPRAERRRGTLALPDQGPRAVLAAAQRRLPVVPSNAPTAVQVASLNSRTISVSAFSLFRALFSKLNAERGVFTVSIVDWTMDAQLSVR